MDVLDSLQIEAVRRNQAQAQAADDEIGQTEFLELLVAQLENQDPLNPQDSAQFAAQLAQFSSVEQLIGVRSGIDELVSLSSGANVTPENLDPTNLVGQDVVVFASQIEVDAARSEIILPFRTIESAAATEVTIRDGGGNIVFEGSVNPPREDGPGLASLPPGDHEFIFNPEEENLAQGVYSIEFSGRDQTGEEVTILPMLEGRVTGAILVGTPGIRIGETVYNVSDVLEVRAPGVRG